MFTKSQADSMLDQEIAVALEELKKLRDDPDNYDAILARISELKKLKSEPRLKPFALESVLFASVNVFGVLWLARYESENPIRARSAFNLLIKPK